MISFPLTHYVDLKQGQTNAIAAITARLIDPLLTMTDVALMVKAVEIMESIQDPVGHAALLEKIAATASALFASAQNGEDILMLCRAMKLGDIPLGGEARWLLLNRDEPNLDLDGDPMIGERTFESFGDAVLDAAQF
nr:conserved uncharacterized protein [uncultured bacterium]